MALLIFAGEQPSAMLIELMSVLRSGLVSNSEIFVFAMSLLFHLLGLIQQVKDSRIVSLWNHSSNSKQTTG